MTPANLSRGTTGSHSTGRSTSPATAIPSAITTSNPENTRLRLPSTASPAVTRRCPTRSSGRRTERRDTATSTAATSTANAHEVQYRLHGVQSSGSGAGNRSRSSVRRSTIKAADTTATNITTHLFQRSRNSTRMARVRVSAARATP